MHQLAADKSTDDVDFGPTLTPGLLSDHHVGWMLPIKPTLGIAMPGHSSWQRR